MRKGPEEQKTSGPSKLDQRSTSAYGITENSAVLGEWAEEEVGGWANNADDTVEPVHRLNLDLTVAGKNTLSWLEGLRVRDGG